MLKSLELKNSIKDLKIEIEDGIKNKIDMSSKAEELDQLIGEYQQALEKENKIKNKNNKEISKVENRKSFNRALKNLLIGKEVQEQDKQFMPKVVDAAGQYVAAGTPGAGAYLVSEEFLPLHKHNAGTVDLAQYCRTINVSKPSGKVPTLDLSQNIELADFAVDNETEIAKKSAVFDQVPYTCKNKGAIIPVGLDLIEDADVDVVAAIHELFDVAKTRARNAEIIAAAKTGATEVAGVDFAAIGLADAIKTALNEKLSTTYAANAKIFVGQATYNKLATLKDENNNYILQPVLAAPGKYAVDGHEVVVLDTVYGLNDVIVGDFNQILNIERKGFEVSSDLSSGFKTYSLNIRAVARYTELNVAPKAFVVIKSA